MMCGELALEVWERIEFMGRIEAFDILTVAALHLTVVPRRVRANELVVDTKVGGGALEKGWEIAFGVGETVGEFKAVVGLDALDRNASSFEPGNHPSQEVGGGKGALFGIGAKEAEAGELVNGSVLEQAQLWVSNAGAWNHLHINLNALTGIKHLFVGLGLMDLARFGRWEHPQLAHGTKQAFRTTGIASFAEAVPKLDHAQRWITTAHILD